MDGTLCDVSSIRHLVNPRPGGRKNFDAFHSASIDCPPHAQVVELLGDCRSRGLQIWIVTARQRRWWWHTTLWLSDNGIDYDELLMRRNDDARKDVKVKADMLAMIERKHVVELAVDDNPSIIELWESRGIPVVTVPGWQ